MTSQATGSLSTLAASDTEDRAIVIGAGMGGLLAARILADHHRHVVVLDRDTLPAEPINRKNVPQGHHVHGLLARGWAIVDRRFPGIRDELVADGALLADSARDMTWFQMGGYHQEPRRGLTAMLMSRPLLEYHIRRRVAALTNVTIIDDCQVTGLLTARDGQRVTGVRVASTGDPLREHELTAALTVDASGRGSRLPAWLEQLGYDVPDPVAAGVEARYSTRIFRRVPGQENARLLTIIVATPANRRGGVAIAQEGDRWLVTLASRGNEQPPTELSAFINWAGSMEAPDIYDIVRQAIPLDDGTIYRFQRSRRHQYDRMDRFPAGLLPFGDAICSFNPVYGQGMTVAAIEAEHLDACLAAGTANLARRFFAGIAAPVEAAWKLAAAGDMRFVEGPLDLSRGERLVNKYMARLLVAAQRDPIVVEAFQRVQHLVELPPYLMRPNIALRVAMSTWHTPSPAPSPALTVS